MDEATPVLMVRLRAMDTNVELGERMCKASATYIDDIAMWQAEGHWTEARYEVENRATYRFLECHAKELDLNKMATAPQRRVVEDAVKRRDDARQVYDAPQGAAAGDKGRQTCQAPSPDRNE